MPLSSFAAAQREKDGEKAGHRTANNEDEYRSATCVLELGGTNRGPRIGEQNSQPGEDDCSQSKRIDGIIKEDRLGLGIIYVQAKRQP